KAAQAAAAALGRERAALEAELAIARAGGDLLFVALRFRDRDATAALESANALSARGVATIVASTPDLVAIAVARRAPEQATHADASLASRLTPIMQGLGGKGGGGALFRASFPSQEALESFVKAASRELGGGA
ncbi:MAG: hypothetical protein Q8M76_16425, partial [Spirochaetaceae bacterium]|nr:hypothetical protein [Spirochaetaceae bacterium]